MIFSLKFFKQLNPLQKLLLLGFVLRIPAIIFSKGFGWFDDHFLIIEPAQSWVDGWDYNGWLPDNSHPERGPQGHPLLYTGFHYVLFLIFKSIGIINPQIKMLFVRLIHALWSLLLIKYAYLITLKISNQKIAWYCGLFMAAFWFMPFLSVHNLVEFICTPFILISIYYLMKEPEKVMNYFWSGLFIGMAISMRFQVVFILAGMGIALLIRRTKFKAFLYMFFGFCISVFFGNCLIDLILWKKPFAEFLEYINYNLNNSESYGYNNYWMYFELLLGMLIPPLSILIFIGFFKQWKQASLLFWPTLVYLIFHIYFPNKQERFVVTILPMYIIAGCVGMFSLWESFKLKWNKGIINFFKAFVFALNLLLLVVFSLHYGKRNKVETMTYLYEKGIKDFWIENSNRDDYAQFPLFYYGIWKHDIIITKSWNIDIALKLYMDQKPEQRCNYLVFSGSENIDFRISEAKKRFPKLSLVTEIKPSFMDELIFKLNPMNENESNFICKIDSTLN